MFIEKQTHYTPMPKVSNVMMLNQGNNRYNMRYLRHRLFVFIVCYKHWMPSASVYFFYSEIPGFIVRAKKTWSL